nr:MAG TPA: hypothetical protein [Caudoviricetes sp.]
MLLSGRSTYQKTTPPTSPPCPAKPQAPNYA